MAADLTKLLAELAKLDAAIDAALTAGRTFDWKVGHVTINNQKSLDSLYKQRRDLWAYIQERCPAEEVESLTDGLDRFGDALIGDDLVDC